MEPERHVGVSSGMVLWCNFKALQARISRSEGKKQMSKGKHSRPQRRSSFNENGWGVCRRRFLPLELCWTRKPRMRYCVNRMCRWHRVYGGNRSVDAWWLLGSRRRRLKRNQEKSKSKGESWKTLQQKFLQK